ncbi:hypothetical protein [Schlesneria paludicola]|uniref:hypothetical protein n=1 Tax=Schlesneria paludicola TaxID=360056 RepID=UPI00029A24F4|nr:hypothetical protein [Schlesneria paludicola]
MFRKTIVLRLYVLLMSLAAIVRSTNAQSSTPSQPDVDPSAAKSGVRFTVETSSRLGTLTYLPEQWGELQLRLENSADTARSLLCTSYFGDNTSLQFGRQLWLPARSKLTLSHPVLFPKVEQAQDHAINVHSLLVETVKGNEVLIKNDSGQLRHDSSLRMTESPRNTGIVAGWESGDDLPQEVLDLVIASRVDQGLSNRTTPLDLQFLPGDETSLLYLDHIVVADNRLIDDEASLIAIRRWLHAGGRLWIMLDRTDPVILERLFGDEFRGHLVDRVGLTSFGIDRVPTLAAPDGERGPVVEHDVPVELAQIVMTGMKVWNTVNGWPVAMTKSFGEGRLLVTTLGARGWIKPTPPDEKKPVGPQSANLVSPYVPLSPMEDLSAYVLGKREPELIAPATQESFAQERISYKVPGWTLIVGTMCSFLALLLATAIWLWRTDRAEHFGWSASLLALLYGVILTGIGLTSRYGVPGTIASVQLVQALEGTEDVRTQGVISVYRPEGVDSLVRTTNGGKFWPRLASAEGSTRRMVTTDLKTFHWDGLPQAAGQQLYSNANSMSFVNRIEARATVDHQGIVGSYQGQPILMTDALLATRYGRIGVKLGSDDRFTASADNVLQADQYLDATFLGDEQDRRRRIFEDLFKNRSWKDYLDTPHLLLWMKDWDAGYEFGEGLVHNGNSLLAVPLQLTRPAGGTEVLIPSPLLSISTRRPPDGSTAAGFWDDKAKVWQERSGASVTWLSFQIPHDLLPLEATKARVEIKISGPSGRTEIMGIKGGASVSLKTVVNPIGAFSFEITDADLLTLSDQGELSLGISTGNLDLSDSSQGGHAQSSGSNMSSGGMKTANYWKIETFALQIWAKVPGRSEKD